VVPESAAPSAPPSVPPEPVEEATAELYTIASADVQTPCATQVFPTGTLLVDIVGKETLLTEPLNKVPTAPPPPPVDAPTIPDIIFL
jgi:hypothetical protein